MWMGRATAPHNCPMASHGLFRAGKTVSEADFERYFRRVYQFYGSASGYQALPDAESVLPVLAEKNLVLGVTSNTPGPN